MAYGLWLYKEIINDTGKKTRLEIEKRDYTGASYEITALKGDIVLSVDVDSPTAPIVKSNLSFSIVDTAQVTYSDFFTPDATLYRVKVYDVNGQARTIRWTGYITPDSFGEPLTYRGEINLTARDNLGYLNDLEFDYNNATTEQYASIKDIVNAAVAKIGGMPVTWYVQKKAATAADGTFDNIENAIVSTYTMLGDNWGNVISELLKGIGCQLRYNDSNAFWVYDIENMSLRTAMMVKFLDGSGYREIQPAWRTGIFSQDYGYEKEIGVAIPSAYSGYTQFIQQRQTWLNYGKYIYMRTSAGGWHINRGSGVNVKVWGLASPYDITENETDKDAVYIPSYDCEDSDRLNLYVQKSISVNQVNGPIAVKFKVARGARLTTYYDPGDESHKSGLGGVIGMSSIVERYTQKLCFDVLFIKSDSTVLHLRENWVEESELTEQWFEIEQGSSFSPTEIMTDIESSVTINSLPQGNGTLYLRIYAAGGNFSRGASSWNFGAEVSTKVYGFSVATEIEVQSGRSRQGVVNASHNIVGEEEFGFGQIPAGSYGIIFYKGGIFNNDTAKTPLSHFKRNPSAIAVDNLLDLIGRETIQYHKKSYNILSGSVKPSDRARAISFGNNISYGGKSYLILSAALSLLENTMQVTQMLEVENYTEEAGIVFSDYTGKNSYSGRSGGGGSSSGGSGISDHQQLTGRDAADAHPMSAVTGLSDALANCLTTEAAARLYHPKNGSANLDFSAKDLLVSSAIYSNVMRANNGSGQWIIGIDTETSDLAIGTTAVPHKIGLYTAAGEVMTIVNGGNVGIGTASPSQKLTVNGGLCMRTLYLPNNGSMSTEYSLSVNTDAITAEIPS